MDTIEQLRRANPDFLSEFNEEPKKEMNVPGEIERLWIHFKRYVELNDRRVSNLQKTLDQKQTELKSIKEFVDKIKDKEIVAATREAVFKVNNSSGNASTVPIDRNGVAPADVSINKIFYTGR